MGQVFLPVTAPQPYRFTRAYSVDLLVRGQQLKQEMALKLLRGERAYPLDLDRIDGGVVFLGRIVFGLGSILARLDAEGEFREMVAQMD